MVDGYKKFLKGKKDAISLKREFEQDAGMKPFTLDKVPPRHYPDMIFFAKNYAEMKSLENVVAKIRTGILSSTLTMHFVNVVANLSSDDYSKKVYLAYMGAAGCALAVDFVLGGVQKNFEVTKNAAMKSGSALVRKFDRS